MKTILSFFFFVAWSGMAQISLQPIEEKGFTFDADFFFGADLQQQHYFEKNGILLKKDQATVFAYQNTAFGKIAALDFKNPLHLLLFYKDFNTIVLLDNQLNATKTISFNLFETALSVEAAGWSSQNKLWIFDGITSRLGLYSIESDSFSWISNPNPVAITHFHTDYTQFYGIDSANYFFSYSINGKKTNYCKLPNFDNIQIVSSELILYSFGNQLFTFNPALNKSTKLDFVLKNNSNYYYYDGILTIFTASEITKLKLILP